MLESEPEIDSPLNFELAYLYKTDKAKYLENVRTWTKKYAN